MVFLPEVLSFALPAAAGAKADKFRKDDDGTRARRGANSLAHPPHCGGALAAAVPDFALACHYSRAAPGRKPQSADFGAERLLALRENASTPPAGEPPTLSLRKRGPLTRPCEHGDQEFQQFNRKADFLEASSRYGKGPLRRRRRGQDTLSHCKPRKHVTRSTYQLMGRLRKWP